MFAAVLAQSGNLEEAAARFDAAVHLKPDANGENDLCVTLYKLHHLDQATIHCAAAVDLKPDFLLARSNLAMMLAAQGRFSPAAQENSTVLSADPNFPGVARL
jgi:Flp pilus assembly protein TadD